MRKTFHKNILRTVKSTFSRFLAIFAIVALGVGFLAGLLSSPQDMRLSADAYYDDTSMFDLRIVSTLGLTAGDLEQVRRMDGVKDVTPVRDTDLILLNSEGDTRTTRVHTLPEAGEPALNMPVLVSGRMPEKPGECVVVLTKTLMEKKDWIGEAFTPDRDEGDEEDDGLPDRLTIVGAVKSSSYLSMEQEHTTVGTGTVELILYTLPESFDYEYYTGFFLTLEGAAEQNAFDAGYQEQVDEAVERMEDLGVDRAKVRYEEIVDDANAELEEARQEYEDKKAEAEEKLADAEKELRDAEQEVADGEQELADAKQKLEDGRQELADAKQEIANGRQELADAERELRDGAREIDDNEKKLADAKQEIAKGRQELADARKDYDEQIADAQAQLDDGYRQIEEYQEQIDDGRKQIEDGQKQLDDGYRQLAAGNRKLNSAKKQLEQTEADLSALETGKAAFWQAAVQMGIPAADTSDTATLMVIGQLSAMNPALAGQFAPLKAGLEALAAQGTDTESARAALEAGKAQYLKNKAAARAAEAELDRNQALLDEQKAELESQQDTLNEKKEELDDGARTLEQKKADAEKEFDEAEKKLEDAQREYDDGAKKLADAKAELNDGWNDYYDGKRKLEDAQREYDDGVKELEDAQREYDDGVKELEDGKKELADGWKEYYDSKAEADEKLEEAEEKLADAEQQIRDIEEGKWYVFTREDNAGFSSYRSNAEKIAAIATVFPLFFFLVAALVALTTMTRMVEEERQQIGTMKALGYSAGRIASKYLLYAAFASILGSVFGLVVGLRLFPYIIINAYNIMYDVPQALTPFNLGNSLFASLTAIFCTLAATLGACWAELREVPARLMLPKAPKAGKRVFLEYITPLWKRLKFTQKVTARNLIRYKKRFFMTVIGIAGCTALLVTGFGVKDSVSHIVSNQYDELNLYQLLVILDEDKAVSFKGALGQDLEQVLQDTASHLAVRMDAGKMVPKGNDPKDDVTIFTSDDPEQLKQFITFRHRMDHSPVELAGDYAVITEKLSERQHLGVGDTITVRDPDGREAGFTVTGICENYVGNYLYLPASRYEEAFGRRMKPNSVLCILEEGSTPESESELSSRLMACKGVLAARFTTEISRSFAQAINSLNSIVLVLIVSAGALAFVVLYNLININISERQKELATIKVLGFYDAEVSAYVYRETAILTLIGTAAGLVLGVFLHQFVIRTAEVDIVMFGRTVYLMSYVWSALLTIAFSVLVDLVMHIKLKNISMVESMKAPE